MLKYIVYRTKTEFTKKYAELLAAKFRLPCFSYEEAKEKISPGESILYMAGIRASKLYDIKKAMRRYNIEAVIGVGMSAPSEQYKKEIIESNLLNQIPFFYLRGGTAPEKLKGFDKLLFNTIANMTKKSKQKDNKKISGEDKKLMDAFFTGADYVDADNLKPIIDWYSSYLIIQDMIGKKYKK
ncbi:MAG TPA: flavodoxin domain-containing protein [Clostridia bacterium]|nr:flavodoxin domain-containing protein [Clostridia bacterium]